MKALYAFEGNAQDSSGSGNHGTANAVSYVTGKVGSQAAQFNGTSSYVSIPRSVTDDFTVAMWVKTTDTAGSAGAQWWSGKGLVDGEVGGGGADWGTAIVNGKFVLGVGSASGDTTIASSVNINDGTWHHVAATRNNTSGAMQVYVDGVLRGSGTGPTGSRTWPPNLRIGSLQTANNFLNGTLDDVRLYDRILTAGEIAALISRRPPRPTGLAAAAGDGSVALSWSASATATNYYVKRSTTSGSGYTDHRHQREPGLHQHRPGQWHALLLRRQRRECWRRKHQFRVGQRASDILRARRHQRDQCARPASIFLARRPHGLAVAGADERPGRRPWHELGQRPGSDQTNQLAVPMRPGERLGVLPVGAAVANQHLDKRQALLKNTMLAPSSLQPCLAHASKLWNHPLSAVNLSEPWSRIGAGEHRPTPASVGSAARRNPGGRSWRQRTRRHRWPQML